MREEKGNVEFKSPSPRWGFTWVPDWAGARVGHIVIDAPVLSSRRRLLAKSWALGEAQARGLVVSGIRWNGV